MDVNSTPSSIATAAAEAAAQNKRKISLTVPPPKEEAPPAEVKEKATSGARREKRDKEKKREKPKEKDPPPSSSPATLPVLSPVNTSTAPRPGTSSRPTRDTEPTQVSTSDLTERIATKYKHRNSDEVTEIRKLYAEVNTNGETVLTSTKEKSVRPIEVNEPIAATISNNSLPTQISRTKEKDTEGTRPVTTTSNAPTSVVGGSSKEESARRASLLLSAKSISSQASPPAPVPVPPGATYDNQRNAGTRKSFDGPPSGTPALGIVVGCTGETPAVRVFQAALLFAKPTDHVDVAHILSNATSSASQLGMKRMHEKLHGRYAAEMAMALPPKLRVMVLPRAKKTVGKSNGYDTMMELSRLVESSSINMAFVGRKPLGFDNWRESRGSGDKSGSNGLASFLPIINRTESRSGDGDAGAGQRMFRPSVVVNENGDSVTGAAAVRDLEVAVVAATRTGDSRDVTTASTVTSTIAATKWDDDGASQWSAADIRLVSQYRTLQYIKYPNVIQIVT